MLLGIIVLTLIAVAGAFLYSKINGGNTPPVQADEKKSRNIPDTLPVSTKKAFFSRAEREFYETLCQALPMEYLIFPNVRLQDLFTISATGKERQGVYARFQDKHVDFLILDSQYRPLIGIELDGPSHDNAKQQYRDAVKDTLFTSAGLPLLRYRNNEQPSVEALSTALNQHLQQRP